MHRRTNQADKAAKIRNKDVSVMVIALQADGTIPHAG
jgi:hypothetical protein